MIGSLPNTGIRRYRRSSRPTSAAAVVFADKEAAYENLASVSDIDDIVWARAYDASGELLAEFKAGPRNGADEATWSGGVVEEVGQSVVVDDERVGELRLGVTRPTFTEILLDTADTALLLFVICLVLALVVTRWLGRMLFSPIERLLQAMKRITKSGDYSVPRRTGVRS